MAPTPAPTCFRCDTKVRGYDGNYVAADDIKVGDELWSPSSEKPAIVRAVVKQTVPRHALHNVVTVKAHACGHNEPSRDTHVTTNHAIVCPNVLMSELVPIEEWMTTYVFPLNVPANARTEYNLTSSVSVCNIDVGNPDVLLDLHGLYAESWDGKLPYEPRPYLWVDVTPNSTVMKRRNVRSFTNEAEYIEFFAALPLESRQTIHVKREMISSFVE